MIFFYILPMICNLVVLGAVWYLTKPMKMWDGHVIIEFWVEVAQAFIPLYNLYQSYQFFKLTRSV